MLPFSQTQDPVSTFSGEGLSARLRGPPPPFSRATSTSARCARRPIRWNAPLSLRYGALSRAQRLALRARKLRLRGAPEARCVGAPCSPPANTARQMAASWGPVRHGPRQPAPLRRNQISAHAVRAIRKTPKEFQKVARGQRGTSATPGNPRQEFQSPSPPPAEERGQGRGGQHKQQRQPLRFRRPRPRLHPERTARPRGPGHEATPEDRRASVQLFTRPSLSPAR